MTGYHVLEQQINGSYVPVAENILAPSANAAIRKHLVKALSVDGATFPRSLFVAVPSRSWKPTKVGEETQTVIRIGGEA